MIQDLTEQIIEWIRFYSILSEPITDYWFSVYSLHMAIIPGLAKK